MVPDQPPLPPADAPYVAKPVRDVSAEPQPSQQLQRWALLDPYTARHARSFAFQLVAFRPAEARLPSSGYALAIGESLTTIRGVLATGALQEHELRLVPDDALHVNISRYQWEAGPQLGPLEPRVRVGFTLLHVDVGTSGFSFGLFTPRVGAGVWLKLSRTRLGLSAFSEYFWRLAGDDSAWVRGFSLELQPDAPPLRKPRR